MEPPYAACRIVTPSQAMRPAHARGRTSAPAVPRPPDLYSEHSVLKVALNYFTGVDSAGRTLFCFKTQDGLESPTLHVRPGDTLDITVTNSVPSLPASAPVEIMSNASNVCGDKTMTETSVNVHFHGTNASPTCHSDEVIHADQFGTDFPL